MDTQSKNQNCQSDEAPLKYGFDLLPQEIVLDVASRLPITSLLQLKFVRKSFYNLSRDAELVKLHLSRAVRNDPCIIIISGEQLYFLDFSYPGVEEEVVRKIDNPLANSKLESDLAVKKFRLVDFKSGFEVVGSCHGLLLFQCHFRLRKVLYVHNPFTRDCKELLESVGISGKILVSRFGFSPITNEYKVVQITHDFLHPCKLVVKVFILGSKIWRRVGELVYEIDSSSPGIMLKGKMHWPTLFGNYCGRCDRLIVYFDLAEEVFVEVPKVDFGVDPSIVELKPAVLRGCLAVALNLPHQNRGGFEIWVMREYNVKESWVKEFKIGAFTPTPRSVTKIWHKLVKVVCLLKNGKLLLED